MTSLMAQETLSIPDVLRLQFGANAAPLAALAKRLQALQPALVVMVGRGSSDHAGVFGKYLIETTLGIPVTAAAPSVIGLYGGQLHLKQAVALLISQSGRSPDLLKQASAIKAGGAYCIAFVNDTASPLAALAHEVVPLHAGAERSVAATKSYVASLAALLQMVGNWCDDKALLSALETLPEHLRQIQQQAPQLELAALEPLRHCVVLGRGFGYAIAREIALKLKEVLGIHAEAFSSAEFLHGPVTLVARQLPLIDVQISDETEVAHRQLMANVADRGANILQLAQAHLKLHPRLLPLALMQRFYLDIEHIAKALQQDVDNPPGLKKITETH